MFLYDIFKILVNLFNTTFFLFRVLQLIIIIYQIFEFHPISYKLTLIVQYNCLTVMFTRNKLIKFLFSVIYIQTIIFNDGRN